MSTSTKDFASLINQANKSFNQQKNLIKKMMAGKAVNCETCGKQLTLLLPEEKSTKPSGIHCAKGCTSIELDFS